ncbi:hypothetical protein T484DRAFT_1821004 [Baffinella frigidus]|nr:hypothetical protein T484DRAFT_1821004 [Cryptophyta sp. CCMP2293]
MDNNYRKRTTDILPREVLANDGSSTDRASAKQHRAKNDFTHAHWYENGESTDVDGDLHEKNREIDRNEESWRVERGHAREKNREIDRNEESSRVERSHAAERARAAQREHEEEQAQRRHEHQENLRVRHHEREGCREHEEEQAQRRSEHQENLRVREAHRVSRERHKINLREAPMSVNQLNEQMKTQNKVERLKQEGKFKT